MKGGEGAAEVDAKVAGSADPGGEDRRLLVDLPAEKSEDVPAGVGRDRRWAYLQMQLWTLWEALTMPTILLPAAFIFMWQAAPDPKGAMFYFYTSHLGFSPEFVGRIKLLEGVAQLLGEQLPVQALCDGLFTWYLMTLRRDTNASFCPCRRGPVQHFLAQGGAAEAVP